MYYFTTAYMCTMYFAQIDLPSWDLSFVYLPLKESWATPVQSGTSRSLFCPLCPVLSPQALSMSSSILRGRRAEGLFSPVLPWVVSCAIIWVVATTLIGVKWVQLFVPPQSVELGPLISSSVSDYIPYSSNYLRLFWQRSEEALLVLKFPLPIKNIVRIFFHILFCYLPCHNRAPPDLGNLKQ